MRKHPILFGFLVVGLVAAVFFVLVMASFSALGKTKKFSTTVWSDSEEIGVIDIVGVIETSEKITEQIRDYVEDDNVRGLLVRIDSPGGAVAPTQEIYSELRKAAKAGKPVVATLGSTAASGGYYVASGCETIVANPGTLTGSIGVIMEFMNAEGALEKLGLKSEVVKSGKFKDTGNFARPMTPDERQILQETIDDVREQFVDAVAEGRGLAPDDVEQIADGRVFSGQQALDLGLVDRLGTFYDAVDVLKEKLGVKGKLNLIFPKKRKPDFLDYFFDRFDDRLQKSIKGLAASGAGGRLYFH